MKSAFLFFIVVCFNLCCSSSNRKNSILKDEIAKDSVVILEYFENQKLRINFIDFYNNFLYRYGFDSVSKYWTKKNDSLQLTFYYLPVRAFDEPDYEAFLYVVRKGKNVMILPSLYANSKVSPKTLSEEGFSLPKELDSWQLTDSQIENLLILLTITSERSLSDFSFGLENVHIFRYFLNSSDVVYIKNKQDCLDFQSLIKDTSILNINFPSVTDVVKDGDFLSKGQSLKISNLNYAYIKEISMYYSEIKRQTDERKNFIKKNLLKYMIRDISLGQTVYIYTKPDLMVYKIETELLNQKIVKKIKKCTPFPPWDSFYIP